MPKIQWSGLPEALRKHLLLRLKERQVSEQDLLKLMEWRQSEPDAPDGLSKEAAFDHALRVALA